MQITLLLLFYLSVPLLLQWAATRYSWIDKVGVVTLCYIVGILVGNIPGVVISESIATPVTEAAVVLSIPLLLFSSDIGVWRRLGPALSLSFFCCVVAVAIAVVTGTMLFKNSVDDAWIVGSMLMGVYTGGTLNLTAIGLALGIGNESLIVVNGTEMLFGALWLLVLLTFGKPLLKTFMKTRDPRESGIDFSLDEKMYWRTSPVALVFAIIIAAIAGGIAFLLFKKEDVMVIAVMLIVTTLGIAGSTIPYIRRLKGSFGLGNYFLLIFCIAVGSQADVTKIFGAAPAILAFVSFVMFTAIVLHCLLSILFRIDVDTFIIASTAGIFGPPFIAPVAKAIKNPYLLPVGIALGLLGLAVGTYLGLGISNLLFRL